MTHKKRLTNEVKECITICTECAHTCIEAIPHCIELEGEHLSRPHVSLLNLCSDICHVAARSLLMGFEFHDHICRACAAICDACADDCETMEEEFMKRCAEACRRCSRSCGRIAAGERAAA